MTGDSGSGVSGSISGSVGTVAAISSGLAKGLRCLVIRWGSSPITLPGFEDIVGVEGFLDLAERMIKVARLAAEELGPGEAAAVLARDRPAEVDRGVEDLAGHRFELGQVGRIAQVEEGPEMELTVAGMGIEGPAHLETFEDVLEPPDQFRQGFRGDGHVFHEGDGTARALHPHQAGGDRPAEAEEEVTVGPTGRLDGVGDQEPGSLDPAGELPEPVEDFPGIIPVDLDDQGRLGDLGDPAMHLGQHVTSQAQGSPVEELAGRRAEFQAGRDQLGRVHDRPNGRTTTACDGGIGTVLSRASVTRARVPSEPTTSRARSIPAGEAAAPRA